MDVSRPRWLDKCHVGRINHMSVGPGDDNRVHNWKGKLYAIELMDEITKCCSGCDVRMGTFLFRCFSGWTQQGSTQWICLHESIYFK